MTVINPGGGSGAASIPQGTFAARPAASPLAAYFATDTGELWIANAAGNAWQSIASTSAQPFKIFQTLGATTAGPTIQLLAGVTAVNNSQLSVTNTSGAGGLYIKEGANCTQGVAGPMVAGAVTVANTTIVANMRIFVCRGAGGTNPGAWYVSAQTVGTSFTITSTNAADTGTGVYEIFQLA